MLSGKSLSKQANCSITCVENRCQVMNQKGTIILKQQESDYRKLFFGAVATFTDTLSSTIQPSRKFTNVLQVNLLLLTSEPDNKTKFFSFRSGMTHRPTIGRFKRSTESPTEISTFTETRHLTRYNTRIDPLLPTPRPTSAHSKLLLYPQYYKQVPMYVFYRNLRTRASPGRSLHCSKNAQITLRFLARTRLKPNNSQKKAVSSPNC